MNPGTSITKVNAETGEVVTVTPFDTPTYLKSLNTGQQQALAAAYDGACAALIGPNDVQQESGRSFKKKSAWRKLARHFGISTAVTTVDRQYLGDVFVATVTVKATAPWGQSSDALGACATDEATGRRVITLADAIATAETRATNRAVSNLIAMGEVSAEEIGNRKPLGAPRPSAAPAAPSDAAHTNRSGGSDFVMPFGKTKGQKLRDLDAQEIAGAVTWARSKGKFTEFQAAADAELERRSGVSVGVAANTPPDFGEMPEALRAESDDEPF